MLRLNSKSPRNNAMALQVHLELETQGEGPDQKVKTNALSWVVRILHKLGVMNENRIHASLKLANIPNPRRNIHELLLDLNIEGVVRITDGGYELTAAMKELIEKKRVAIENGETSFL